MIRPIEVNGKTRYMVESRQDGDDYLAPCGAFDALDEAVNKALLVVLDRVEALQVLSAFLYDATRECYGDEGTKLRWLGTEFSRRASELTGDVAELVLDAHPPKRTDDLIRAADPAETPQAPAHAGCNTCLDWPEDQQCVVDSDRSAHKIVGMAIKLRASDPQAADVALALMVQKAKASGAGKAALQ